MNRSWPKIGTTLLMLKFVADWRWSSKGVLLTWTAGQYSRASTALLSNENLCQVALTANLHTATAGPESYGERAIGTLVEAIVGAVYLDSGMMPHHVRNVLKRLGLRYEDMPHARPRASLGGMFGASNGVPCGVSSGYLEVSEFVRDL